MYFLRLTFLLKQLQVFKTGENRLKYFDFMESTYAKSSLDNQLKFNSWTNAEAKAAHTLISIQRGFYTYLHYGLLMFKFSLMILGLTKAPRLADDIIKEAQEAAQLRAQAKKENQVDSKVLSMAPPMKPVS